MQTKPLLPHYYLITDRKQYPQNDILPVLEKNLRQGIRLIQLRQKDLPFQELSLLAKKAKALCLKYHARLLINSHVDIARDLDGVHLPASGESVAAARHCLGPHQWIGKSTHSLEEAQNAEKEGADFITFSPIFKTPSKQTYVGLEALREICQKTTIPVFALGGLEMSQLDLVKQQGAHGIAGIRTFL